MTPFKPTTDEARNKVQAEIIEVLRMFKEFLGTLFFLLIYFQF